MYVERTLSDAGPAEPAGPVEPTEAAESLDALLRAGASRPDADAMRALAAARARILGSGPREDGTPNEPAADFGRYAIGEAIGVGGMGRVFAAHDTTLDREVALKLLRGGLAPSRLRDEARALALLSHPNIVTVFDLGPTKVDDEIFVVMERVPGTTLRAWLETPRQADEILTIFRAIGRGMSAAHRTGVVHGDIKPDNIVVTPDGTPKILDFGLARLVGDDDPTTRSADRTQGASDDTRLGRRGHGGTPRYMAPEQKRGEPPDAAGDQYAFCVALTDALATAIGRKPSRHLLAAVARGKAEQPANRWPSMDELVAALGFRPPSPVVPLVVVGGVLTAAWFAWQRPPATACNGLVPSWTVARRDALVEAFAAPGTPYAASLGRRVTGTLDLHADQIASAWASACIDITVHAKRMQQCVEAADVELAATADAMIGGGQAMIDRARTMASMLSDPAQCLTDDPPQPIDSADLTRWRADLASAVQRTHTDARGGLEIIRRVRTEAEAAGAPRIAAEAHWMEGASLGLLRDASAFDVLISAVESAGAAGFDEIEMTATTDLVALLREAGRFDDAEHWARHGVAVAERIPASEGYRARLDLEAAHITRARGDLDQAEARYRDAIAVLREQLGNDNPHVAIALNAVGTIELGRGEIERARDHYCEAEQILVGVFGKDLPRTIETAINCAMAQTRFDPEASRVRLLELVTASEQHFGVDDARTGNALANLASAELQLGMATEAVGHMRRSDDIVRKALGEAHPNRLIGRLNLGLALLDAAAFADAETIFVDTLSLCEAALGSEHPIVAEAWIALARARIGTGAHAAAVEAATRGSALQDRVATDPVRKAEAHSVLAQALLAAGRDSERAGVLAREALVVFGDDPALSSERTRARAVLDALSTNVVH